MRNAAARIRRRQLLVDPKLQLAITLPMIGVLAALAGVFLITFFVSAADDIGPNSASTRRLGTLVTSTYFVLVLAATVFAGIVATHRVAGPARVIEHAVRGMREKDWSRRLTLRDRDHLESLASELSALRDELQRDAEARREQADRLRSALAEGDIDTARQLVGIDSDSSAPKPQQSGALPADARSGGFALMEVILATLVIAVAVLGVLTSITSGHQLQQRTQEHGIASRAMTRVHESLRNGDLDTRVAEFKAAPTFVDGPVTVTVSFPEAMLVALLGGSVPAGWRYRDGDTDGDVDLDLTSTATSSLLPVAVRATWAGGELTSNFFVTEK